MKIDEHKLLIVDGACGTNIQGMDLPPSVWGDKEGCNEYLNLSAPEAVVALHGSFIDAGATIVETNTFGATRIVLVEYGLESRVTDINAAAVAHARAAIGSRPDRYVAGSIGPGTKLPSLGHISYEAMHAAYTEQILALAEAGADLLIVETSQDILQTRIAVIACLEAFERLGRVLPIMASLTFERTGTMLVGTDIAAAVASLEPFPLFSLGLNCATGPADMVSKMRFLARHWPGRISCIPNQGLPEIVDGKTTYPLAPEAYARFMKEFVLQYGVSIVGGCCGTTPEHTRRLVMELEGVVPPERAVALAQEESEE